VKISDHEASRSMQRIARSSRWRTVSSVVSVTALAGAGVVAGCGAEAESLETRQLTEQPPLADAGVPATSTRAPVLAPSGGTGGAETGSADDFLGGAPVAPAALSPEQACASRAVQAETIERVVEVPVEEEVVVPSVFYLMLDSSGSMVQDPFSLASLVEQILDLFGLGRTPPAPNKWDFALKGLESFVNDPASAGLELGLGYFPGGGACDGSGYDIPAVPLGVLPENAAAIEASLGARVPAGGTPLEGALRGATGFCLAYNAEHPEASCVAVLITDGAAEECDARSAAALASIAGSAAEQGVLTYAAGMEGADFAVLDAIGAAGGGDCDVEAPGFACDLTADSTAFVDALNGIRDRTRTRTRIETRIEREVSVLPCQWEIPEPPAGEVFDPSLVNVQLGLPGGPPLALENVPLPASCGDGDGWFYDDALAPTTLSACPATCERLGAEPETRIDLLFGCKTLIR
jgi:hypothetical protein